jgi:hypothetical protein
MNSSSALWAVAEGSRRISIVWFRQTHSSIASETNCCLVMPRKSHCLVSHSNCFELTSIRIAPPDRSGSSGDDPDSLFRTHQIAGRSEIGFTGNRAINGPRNLIVDDISSMPPSEGRSAVSNDFFATYLAGFSWISKQVSSNLLAFPISLNTSHQPGSHAGSLQGRRLVADFFW